MPGAFSSRKHFLFDLDGTLVDSSGAHARAYRDILKANHPKLARDFNYTRFAGQPTRQVFAALGFRDESELTDLTRRKQEVYREALDRGEVAVFPGVNALLAQLGKAGRQLFVVTGASRESAERVLKSTHLADHFAGMITAEDAFLGKPAPDPYLRALATFKLPRRECLAIEDGPAGVTSALDAGIDVVSIHGDAKIPGVANIRNFADLAAFLLE